MLCYILDDQYGARLYQDLSWKIAHIEFPVTTNIKNPLNFLEEICRLQPEYILLDNFFPGQGNDREQPLGDAFLEQLLQRHISTKVICISDYGTKLLDNYYFWDEAYKQWLIVGRVPSKQASDIIEYLQ